MGKAQLVNYKFLLLDSLQKVMPNQQPDELRPEKKHLYGFSDERVSFQLAYTMEYGEEGILPQELELHLESELQAAIQLRKVELVPSRLPGYYGQMDEDYLYEDACLCPDVLIPMTDRIIKPIPYQWRAIWFTVDLGKVKQAGECSIEIQMKGNQKIVWKDTFWIHKEKETLPKQSLIHTEWIHADCLADYYHVSAFSEEHWSIIDKFMDSAVRHGVNMLLTPIFTPPLDTREGGERTTVQLVKIWKDKEHYEFDFSLLERWIDLCKYKGIEYIEISHLFTQWGAKYAPKIIAWENEEEKQIFGWNTSATGEDYQQFLAQFIPKLKQFLKEKGVLEKTYFHISDEPGEEQKETYAAAKNSVKELLKGCMVIDALSSYELYREGVVEHPVVSNDSIQPFIDAGVNDLWTYYCCVQGYRVSNRFMAIPPQRNRILGVQLYLYDIKGFLHWGFNFYNSQHSLEAINPYLITDANGAFPSGDPFVVYPAPDGSAYDSIRWEVFAEALYDLRALQKLEEKTNRNYVIDLIQEGVEQKITFVEYPKDAEYIRNLRRRIHEEIEKTM